MVGSLLLPKQAWETPVSVVDRLVTMLHVTGTTGSEQLTSGGGSRSQSCAGQPNLFEEIDSLLLLPVKEQHKLVRLCMCLANQVCTCMVQQSENEISAGVRYWFHGHSWMSVNRT